MLQLLAFFETEPFHDLGHAIGGPKVTHQIVFETDIEPARPRIALARAASAQLTINPARLMTLRADDIQTAFLRNTETKFNVRAAAGHVGRNRNRTALTGATHNLGFLPVIFRV